ILEEASGVVLPLHREAEATPHAGVDAVRRDQIRAANQLFLVAAIGVRDARGDPVSVLRQALELRAVFDIATEARTRVLAHEAFGLALVVRQDAVVAGVD